MKLSEGKKVKSCHPKVKIDDHCETVIRREIMKSGMVDHVRRNKYGKQQGRKMIACHLSTEEGRSIIKTI